MTEQGNALKWDTKEIVERILVRVYRKGFINEGQLPKDALKKETNSFLIKYCINHFKYTDMPKEMLRYDYCYYMKKDLAHSSKCFLVKTGMIEKLTETYAEEEMEESGNEQDFGDHCLQYVLTTEQTMKGNFAFSDKSCFVCKETFNDQKKYEDHMKSHGLKFTIKATNWWKKIIDLTSVFQVKEGKFVCKVSVTMKEAQVQFDRILIVFPEDNTFHPLSVYKEGNCTKFDMHCELFSTVHHPYTILIFYTFGCSISLLTQYHFTLKKLMSTDDIALEEIKEKRISNLPNHVKTMTFETLPLYLPPKNMKMLIEKNFDRGDLNSKEIVLLSEIEDLFDTGLTQTNYVKFWITLIQMEDCAQTENLSKIDKYNEKLIWSQGYYLLEIPDISEHSCSIMEGDRLTVAPSEHPKNKIFARIHQVKKYHIVLDVETSDVLDVEVPYDIHFLPNRMTIQLEREALNYVHMQNIARFFFPETIPTHPIEVSGFHWINESVKSNPEQQSAIMHIVGKSSFPAPYILMGPPGTGKTTTIVEAICQIIKRNESTKILVAATSNYACNVIAYRLLKILPEKIIFRMFAMSKQGELDSIDKHLVNISNLKYGSHYYPHMDELAGYNVVLTTLAIAGKFAQAKISRTHFAYVFIDESGSSTEPSTLIPIAGVISSVRKIHGQIVLAGDPMQLGPIVQSDEARESLGVSLLERLIDTGIYSKDPKTGKYNPRVITKLIRNFRSHPKILEFSDEVFYSGELLAEGSPEITRWACGWKFLPNKSVPIIFEHVIGESEQDDSSPSWYNIMEVRRVMFHIDQLMKAKNIFGRKITQNCIGVITPYKKQCQKISIECKKRNWEDIDVGSVEQFQGQEKPVIILSTVRSLTRGVGFLNNPKRLNVALTRAQALLIVVGNVDTLQTDPTWNEFIDFCKGNNLIKKINEIGRVQQKRTKLKGPNQQNSVSSIRKIERVSSEMSLILPDVPKDTLISIPDTRKNYDCPHGVRSDIIEKEMLPASEVSALADAPIAKANAIYAKNSVCTGSSNGQHLRGCADEEVKNDKCLPKKNTYPGEFDISPYTDIAESNSLYKYCVRPKTNLEVYVPSASSAYEFVNAPIQIHYDVSRPRSPTIPYSANRISTISKFSPILPFGTEQKKKKKKCLIM